MADRWALVYNDNAKRDLRLLDKSVRMEVAKAIEKVRHNPLPRSEGGYGNALGNKNAIYLTGC